MSNTTELFNSKDSERITKKINEFIKKFEKENNIVPVSALMEFFENESKKDPKFIRFLVVVYANAAKILSWVKNEYKEENI